MGVVWAAVNEAVDGEVALKLLQSKNPELRRRLLREAKACGRLAHPNIVKVYDVGETSDGDPFLVMELLRGETLSDRLRRERAFSPNVAVGIAINVARALRAAHNADVIHRDLKPANIFLYRESDDDLDAAIKLKVLDFGVSKLAIENESTATVSGVLLGSPAYMSPEQAQALPIDGRADLWSLGVVLFEMLTGVRPFQSRSMTGVLAELLNKPIQRIDALVPSLDPALCDIVASCLQRNIELRVKKAEDLINMLRPFASRDDQPSSWDGAHIALLPPRLPSLSDLMATTSDGHPAAAPSRDDDSEEPDPISRPRQPEQPVPVDEPTHGNTESQRPTLEMPTRRPSSANTPVPNPPAESPTGGSVATTLASGGSGGSPSAGGLTGTISTLSTTPVSHGPPGARQPITLPPALRRWKVAGSAPLIAISATLGLAIGLAVVFSSSGSRDAGDGANASATANPLPLPSAPLAAPPLPSLVTDSGEPAPTSMLSASASARPKAPIAPPRPGNRGSAPGQPPRKPFSPKGP